MKTRKQKTILVDGIKHYVPAPVTDKGIVFPSDEEMYMMAKDSFSNTSFEGLEKTGNYDLLIDAIKERIQILNKR